MKRFILIITGLFFISLGLTLGMRMSPDAMAMIVGVALGIIATVPTTFLLFYILRQREKQQAEYQHRGAQYPPVVVVNSPPGGQGYGVGLGPGQQALLPPAGERAFKVVGQDDVASETLGSAFNISSVWDEVK